MCDAELADSASHYTQVLDLSGCKHSEGLPEGTDLPHLKQLNLSRCDRFTQLPWKLLHKCSSLSKLSMAACIRLQRLPPSLGGLYSLLHLDLSLCIELQVGLTSAVCIS